jgi:hypothetical protein
LASLAHSLFQHTPFRSAQGLGCAKTPALAPHVEISLINCISESQNILHARCLVEEGIFYISRMYEFLHSQGHKAKNSM